MLVPKSLNDYQQLLDNYLYSYSNATPGLSEISADNFYAGENTIWYDPTEEHAYFWEENVYSGSSSREWSERYTAIFYMNVILEGLDDMETSDTALKQQLTGSAHFFRGAAYYALAQTFTIPYSPQTKDNALGVPLRLSSDVTTLLPRGSQDELYNLILSDLKTAADLLPDNSEYVHRPNRPAALGMLARISLNMHRYEEALEYSSKALEISPELLDYNTLTYTPGVNPFPVAMPNSSNKEVLIYMQNTPYTFIDQQMAFVDTLLISSYNDNDLRKQLFFMKDENGNDIFIGNYTGNFGELFGGVATDELYLIKAEAAVRLGRSDLSVSTLDELLANRYKTGTFPGISVSDQTGLLNIIIGERRKELIGRGLRWEDLRRLNQDPDFALTLIRKGNGGQVFELLPNSNRYTFPIPNDEINRSGIEQNAR